MLAGRVVLTSGTGQTPSARLRPPAAAGWRQPDPAGCALHHGARGHLHRGRAAPRLAPGSQGGTRVAAASAGLRAQRRCARVASHREGWHKGVGGEKPASSSGFQMQQRGGWWQPCAPAPHNGMASCPWTGPGGSLTRLDGLPVLPLQLLGPPAASCQPQPRAWQWWLPVPRRAAVSERGTGLFHTASWLLAYVQPAVGPALR